MRRRPGFVSFVALLLALSVFGCKQGEGETCQIDTDCKDDLECVLENTNMVCRNPGDTPPDIDAGPDIDATPVIDAAPTPDAIPVDAAAVDAAGIDA